jgi:hypothetical protein
MHHKGVLTIGKAIGRPYHIQCACGSAGDFATEAAATAWFNAHIARIGKTETSELVVPGAKKPTSVPSAAQPKPTVPPASLAPAPPPAPQGVAKGGSK